MFSYWQERIEQLQKHMKWYDFSLLKGSVFFFTLFLVTAFASVQNLVFLIPWYVHLLIGVVLAIPLWKKMFSQP